MFDILVGRKFSNKCKHSVKCIKCRIELIRKKKQVMVKYLKKDVADLLAGGHDANAFGRIDALIVEINHASCYDMIEQYCGCLLEHLSTMCKERECPKEAMEAVATLIFAAARFSDLPELIDLRSIFTKRYETRMESCINKEFVAKIQNKSFSKVRKLEVMEDIVQEFSVNWNSNMFENKMSNQSAPVHGKALKHQLAFDENEKQFAMRALQNLEIKPEEQIEFQTNSHQCQ
ncbi:IST1 homolog [Phalaenopsis equestris]|uniref:IST1 homolog n=1 Tax=Phalaenopsis equestris TaxID=78828 RepID=UPI0009E1E7B2|nr:IST1 homolog [Phalaenopsis equestris]